VGAVVGVADGYTFRPAGTVNVVVVAVAVKLFNVAVNVTVKVFPETNPPSADVPDVNVPVAPDVIVPVIAVAEYVITDPVVAVYAIVNTPVLLIEPLVIEIAGGVYIGSDWVAPPGCKVNTKVYNVPATTELLYVKVLLVIPFVPAND
jgi:hypothetical protein